MAIKKKQSWTLPLVFLLGYIVAWATILIDRQMIISSQAELKRELQHVRQELQLREMINNFDDDWQQMLIWNEEKELSPPKEAESGQVDK